MDSIVRIITGPVLFIFLGIGSVMGQSQTYVGINVSPLLVNTLDARWEHQFNANLAIQGAVGFRSQDRAQGEFPRIAPLKDYVQFRNNAFFFSVGGRIFNRMLPKYPYIALDFTGVYYDELIQPRSSSVKIQEVSNFKVGTTLTIGMVSQLFPRFYVDFGLQFGYASPRDELLVYYLPGMGYTTFGFGKYGVEGGLVQPVITLKYDLFKDKRQRIREME